MFFQNIVNITPCFCHTRLFLTTAGASYHKASVRYMWYCVAPRVLINGIVYVEG